MSRSLLVVVLLGGCTGPLPEPRIGEVFPDRIVHGTVPGITIGLAAVFPFDAEYGTRRMTVDARVTAAIGGLAVRAPSVNGDGDIAGQAPFGLPEGSHEVKVDLADGRSASRAAALTVESGPFPAAFTIDPISDQQAQTPFTITIRGTGDRWQEFAGAVRITATAGTISPDISGHFTNGVHSEAVTIPAPVIDVRIVVRDAQDHFGVSNLFSVN